MMSALVLIRTQTKPHKNIFVSQDLFYLTIVQALHHIFIFIPIVISVFYSKKYLHIYCYEASLPQSTFFVAQWGKKKKKSTYQYRRCGFNLWVKKFPWRRKWQPVFSGIPAWEIHGQKSLTGYSIQGPKELDMI